MFALPNPMSQVSSAAYAQTRLGPDSPLAQVYLGVLIPSTQCGAAKITSLEIINF